MYISLAFNPVTSIKIIKKHLVKKSFGAFEGNSCQSKPSILIHHGQLLFQAKIFNFKVECVSYTMSLSASKYRLPFFNNVSFMISDIKCSGMNHSPSFSESCSLIIQFFFNFGRLFKEIFYEQYCILMHAHETILHYLTVK